MIWVRLEPPVTLGANVQMQNVLSVAGVNSQSTRPPGHQLLPQLASHKAIHHNINTASGQVLAATGTTNAGIPGVGTIPGGDNKRSTNLLPCLLQLRCKANHLMGMAIAVDLLWICCGIVGRCWLTGKAGGRSPPHSLVIHKKDCLRFLHQKRESQIGCWIWISW